MIKTTFVLAFAAFFNNILLSEAGCGENEVPSDCINGGCDKKYCTQVGRAAICIDLIAGACQSGCLCASGYLRTQNGTCVLIDQCPASEVCSNRNEYLDQCPASCPSRDCRYEIETSCPSPLQEGDPDCQEPMCRCKDGYYRNSYQDCVPYELCSRECTGINEIFYAYPESCGPETCDSLNDRRVEQSAPTSCEPHCRCQPDYYRNKSGRCVPREDCGKCEGANEYFGCRQPCDNVCATLETSNQTYCPVEYDTCKEMCYCDADYARDANNNCVPITECSKTSTTTSTSYSSASASATDSSS